jgi:hypothetical protein
LIARCNFAHNNASICRSTPWLTRKSAQKTPVDTAIFFLEAFCDISHRLGGITPYGVFSDAFPGLKMWVTFACATANFLTHFKMSIAVLENMPPDAVIQKRATFPHQM